MSQPQPPSDAGGLKKKKKEGGRNEKRNFDRNGKDGSILECELRNFL
jgi:hypothetical protein